MLIKICILKTFNFYNVRQKRGIFHFKIHYSNFGIKFLRFAATFTYHLEGLKSAFYLIAFFFAEKRKNIASKIAKKSKEKMQIFC